MSAGKLAPVVMPDWYEELRKGEKQLSARKIEKYEDIHRSRWAVESRASQRRARNLPKPGDADVYRCPEHDPPWESTSKDEAKAHLQEVHGKAWPFPDG